MGDIIKFPVEPTPDEVLQQSVGGLAEVLVIGWDHDGNLVIRGSVDVGSAIMLLETAKHTFIAEMFEE
ncbi:MAG: hypothetical protein ACO3JV_14505 [Pseudomonadales bacterium]